MTFSQAIYSYDPYQLGLPNHQAPPQSTEPFWYQYEQVEQYYRPPHLCPTYGYTHYNFIYDPFSMQDFVPVFIGSNTANGKVLTDGESATKRERGRGKYSGDRINVYIGDTVVDVAQVKDLVRFSRTIGAKFSNKQEGKEEDSSQEKLGFTVEVTRSNANTREIKLINDYSKIWTAPPAWAFVEVLGWMNDVRKLPHGHDLPQFGVKDIQHFNLHELVDVYAATIILDLRPKPIVTAFRGHIIRHLAYVPATAEDFQYLHEHLPVGDAVLKKMIDTFFMHGERFHYKQKQMRGEVPVIKEYVNSCGHAEFKELVIRTMEGRNKARLARQEAAKGNGRGKGKEVERKETAGPSQKKENIRAENDAGKAVSARTPPPSNKLPAELCGDSLKDSAVGSSPQGSA